MLVAVTVPPLTLASTTTWCPSLTEPMPSRCASTRVELVTWYVLVKPSALLTVMDERLDELLRAQPNLTRDDRK